LPFRPKFGNGFFQACQRHFAKLAGLRQSLWQELFRSAELGDGYSGVILRNSQRAGGIDSYSSETGTGSTVVVVIRAGVIVVATVVIVTAAVVVIVG
jgi:hypothetical protein